MIAGKSSATGIRKLGNGVRLESSFQRPVAVRASACNAKNNSDACIIASSSNSERTSMMMESQPVLSKRSLLLAVASIAPLSCVQPSRAEESTVDFVNTKQKYRMVVPAAWEKVEKMGADALFEDPSRRSSSLGVTVNPVRVARIQEFGGVDAVGTRLLDTERKKESTIDVKLISSSSRTLQPLASPSSQDTDAGADPVVLYDYEYELNSTRGLKRIVNSVTIYNSQLYILNGVFKCDANVGCDAGAQDVIALMRTAAASFNVSL